MFLFQKKGKKQWNLQAISALLVNASRIENCVETISQQCPPLRLRLQVLPVLVANIIARQNKSLEDREIGRRFARLWEAFGRKAQRSLPPRTRCTITNAQHFGSQEWSGKTGFKLAPPGHEHLFDLTALGLCDPTISDDVLRLVICPASHLAQIARPMCDGHPFGSSPFRHLASRGYLFRGSSVVDHAICDLFGSILTSHDSVPCHWGKRSTSVQWSIRRFALLFLCRSMAWPTSMHIDANTTL